MNIAILGYGRVSATLLKLLNNNDELKVKKVLEYQEVIDEIYDLEVKNILTNNFIDILYDDSIDLIIECFENRDFSYNYVKEALKKKKHFILTNSKILSSNNFDELVKIAKENNVSFKYETCYNCNNGLLRLIDEVNQTPFTMNKFDLIEATLSPSCNYLINLMASGMEYENAKDSLVASGIKEVSVDYELSGNHSRDLIGFLCNFSLKTKINKEDIYVYPLSNIDISDIKYNEESGYHFKYLSYLKVQGSKCNIICEPVLVNQANKFYNFKLDSLVHLNTNLGRDIYLSLDSYHDRSIATYIIVAAIGILKNKEPLAYENKATYSVSDDVYSRYYIHFKNDIKGTTERISRKELAKILGQVKFYARIID